MVNLWRRFHPYLIAGSIVLIIAGWAVIDVRHTAPDQGTFRDIFSLGSRSKPLLAPPPILPPQTLPMGGHMLFPHYQLVALYGAIDSPALGALGEQPMGPAMDRVKQLAKEYQPFVKNPDTTVMSALEIIATVASASPTDNNDYSRENDVLALKPWVEAAQKANIYVVLDLQPGRNDFLTQAKEYAGLLKYPNVGLALDPEWRLKPDQVHLAQIGSVDAAEINQTSAWLADLTAKNHLPQKLLLIHQFRLDMIINRPALDTSHAKELAITIQMDGHGSQSEKQATWQAIMRDAPAGISFGWKNFYSKDTPMLSPQETMGIVPEPGFVSYQ